MKYNLKHLALTGFPDTYHRAGVANKNDFNNPYNLFQIYYKTGSPGIYYKRPGYVNWLHLFDCYNYEQASLARSKLAEVETLRRRWYSVALDR